MQAAEHRAAIYTLLNALSADAVCFATFVWNRVDAHFMYEAVAMGKQQQKTWKKIANQVTVRFDHSAQGVQELSSIMERL